MMTHVFAVEARGRLDEMKKAVEAHMAADCASEDRGLTETAADLKRLSETIEAFNLLVRYKDGSFRPAPKKIDLWAVFKDIEDGYRGLVGGKEVELALECHNSLLDSEIYCDQKTLQMLITALLRHAVRVTEIGMITLLASIETRNGAETLELTLSDTGVGVDPRIIDWTARGGVFPCHRVDLGVAGEFAELLGGRLVIENLPGKGSLVTVLIPNRKPQAAQGSERPASAPETEEAPAAEVRRQGEEI
jgi:signal transduction histidine kinase